ncbi:MAG: hypothetical protein ABI323_09075 [Solirubrobacteraceae bacterium]
MAVQIAAHGLQCDQWERLAPKRTLAQLRRAPGDAKRGVDRGLVGPLGQRLEGADVRRRAGCPQQLGAEARRWGEEQLDRHPLDGHPESAPVLPLNHRHDLWQLAEPVERAGGLLRPANDAQVLAQVASPAHVPGGLSAERRRDALHQIGRPVEQQALPGPGLRLSAERLQ